MRHFLPGLLQLLSKHCRSIWFNHYLGLKISSRAVSKVFMILPCKTVCAPVYAPTITVHGVPPTTFPVRGKRLGDHLPGGSFLKDLELCRRGFPNILG